MSDPHASPRHQSTDSARSEALLWAESLRESRAQTCDDLAHSRTTLESVLDRRSDPRIGPIHVLCLLESLPGARKVDTRRALAAHGLPERAAIGSFTDAQIAALKQHFGGAGHPEEPDVRRSRTR